MTSSKKLQNCPICNSQKLSSVKSTIRDSDSIGVSSCDDCHHVFLDSFEHINVEYFEQNKFLDCKKVDDDQFAETFQRRINHFSAENENRFERIKQLVCNKNVLDFGCGAGGLMRLIKPLCKSVIGIEKTASFVEKLKSENYDIRTDLSDIDELADILFSFHVFEHVPNPVQMLKDCLSKLKPGGQLYIEVPNRNDALLALFDVPEYQDFYYFKSHLQYFDRKSLASVFDQAGVAEYTITGHNRFGLDNHLYWLNKGKPGGHTKWNFLSSANDEYVKALALNDYSDSLIVQATKPSE